MADPKTIPNGIKFLFGGLSGMGATLFVQVITTQQVEGEERSTKPMSLQPLDLVKTRMQVAKSSGAAKPSTFSVITGVIKNEGFTTLYNGLSAGLLRQATYTTTRLGIYTWLFEKFSTDGKPPNFAMKAGLG